MAAADGIPSPLPLVVVDLPTRAEVGEGEGLSECATTGLVSRQSKPRTPSGLASQGISNLTLLDFLGWVSTWLLEKWGGSLAS